MPQRSVYLRLVGKARTNRASRMRTHRVVKLGGKKRRVPVAHFWKDVIAEGTYRHPVTSEIFKVTKDRMSMWLRKFQKMRERGIEIPTPIDHSDRAEDNRGFVVDARINKGRLQLLHEVVGEDGVRLACRNRASVFVDPDFVDEHGKQWGEAITHSAFTPKPVISGQGEFVPFAASRSSGGKQRKIPVFYFSRTKEPFMAARIKKKNGKTVLSPKQLKRARKILGIEPDEDVSDSDILRRLVSQSKLSKAAKKGLTGDDSEEEDEEDSEADDAEETVEQDDDSEEEDEESDDAEEETAEDDDEESDDDADEEDEEDEEDDDEEEDNNKSKPKSKKGGKGNRKKVIAERRKRRVRELSSTVSLSRVPRDTDAAVLTMVKRSLKTERRRCIDRGAITPDVDDALAELLFTKGKPNGLALSRMPGSDDPLAFRIYEILRRNRPVPKNKDLGNQSMALSRTSPGKKGVDGLDKNERNQIRSLFRKAKKKD